MYTLGPTKGGAAPSRAATLLTSKLDSATNSKVSDLKRSRDSSPHSSGNEDTSHSEEDAAATTNKKTRAELDDTIPASTEVHATGELGRKIRTAIDLNHAIKRAFDPFTRILPIGYSLTTYEERDEPSEEQQEVLKALRDIYRDVPLPYRHGVFEETFHLSITRPNYKYDGHISQGRSVGYSEMREWYENGADAGYGDMESLETKVDVEVRHAREIIAGEFTVDPKLLEFTRDTWAKGFIPGNVRVVPYKIQIYGQGGHFKAHRDTPEEGLVGTFLVGLGDTTCNDLVSERFRIGDLKLRSRSGSWVAFHPDVPHSVLKLERDDFRAVLALKIFRDGEPVEHEAATREAALVQRVGAIINEIPVPYGVLLDHKYHMGVRGLNGFDAIMLSAAKQRPGTAIHLFPVLISSASNVYYDVDEYDGRKNEFTSKVLPLTEAHVDLLLATNADSDSGADSDAGGGAEDEAKARIKFFKNVKDVPFYSRDFEDAADRWQQQKQEINYTGNEADGERESSVYLSYALLVLPSPASDD